LKRCIWRKEKRLGGVYKDCYYDIEVVIGFGGIKKVGDKE
jgi:hypothetical protein